MNRCARPDPGLSSRTVRHAAVLTLLALGACKTSGGIPLVGAEKVPAFPEDYTVVDLTRPLDRAAPFVPHAEAFPFERVEFKGPRETGWRTGAYSGLEHMGTHVASPLARLPVGASVEKLSAPQLVAPLVVLDVPASAAGGGLVTAADVKAEELARGTIPPGAVVVLRTGRGAMSPADPALLGRKPDGSMSWPGWGDDAIRLLAVERRVRAIGTDCLAVDSGTNAPLAPAQSAGSAVGLWFVAGLADLAQIPPRGATIVVGVLPISGAAGAPARVFALVPALR